MTWLWFIVSPIAFGLYAFGIWRMMQRIERMLERWEQKQEGVASAERVVRAARLDGIMNNNRT